MNNRVSFVTNLQGRVRALGKDWPDMATARKGVAEIIARRERIAGRALSERELREGVHGDAAANAMRHFHPIQPPQPEQDPNPFRRFELQAETKQESPKQRRARLAREWDERNEKAAADKAHRESPKYRAAQEYVEELWEKTAFDPSSTPEDLIGVEKLRKQLDGDFDAFASMSESVAARQAERHGVRVKAAEEQIAKAQAQLEALQPKGAFTGNNYVPAGAKVGRTWNATDGEKIVVTAPGVSQTGESYTRVLHSWPSSEAPAEVEKMAPKFKDSPNE